MRYEPLTALHIGEIKRLWNEVWGHIFPMRERILEQNILEDPNFLRSGSWVARDESSGQITGYVVSKMWKDNLGEVRSNGLGWIHMLLVSPDFRGRGIGGALLTTAEEALHERGVKEIQLGKDLHRRIFPGVPEPIDETGDWLERRGYKREPGLVDLYRHFQEEDVESLPKCEGITFRYLNEEEANVFNAFIQRCFPQWLYQTLAYWQYGGTGREFVVCEKDGEIIGFCRMNDAKSPLLAQNIYWAPLFRGELGGIGPLGIDEQYRGLGYGLAIVQAAIHLLQSRGVRDMVIDTTPFIEFYGKLGFKAWRYYIPFRKQIGE